MALGPGGVPIGAPLLAPTIYGNGARLDLPASDFIQIETELALCLARDLTPWATPYTRQCIVAAIASVSSAFEIVIPRAGEPPEIPFGFYLADYLGNGATVIGPLSLGHLRRKDAGPSSGSMKRAARRENPRRSIR
ncbi:hypothetical protein [Bosea sp. MMO-172]|uniref:hypothetical protein n=1 Tax=Bosea sp. MMO-172 TaxID=3127885 RepID=UPI00301976A3